MKNLKLYSWLTEIFSAFFILLFVYTGISKLNEQNNFRAVLSRSPLIGSKANLFSWFLPVTELLTALLLFIPFTREWGLMISLVLMFIFTGYKSFMIISTLHLPCSCGGVLKQMIWRQHLKFNVLFTTLAAFGIWVYKKN